MIFLLFVLGFYLLGVMFISVQVHHALMNRTGSNVYSTLGAEATMFGLTWLGTALGMVPVLIATLSSVMLSITLPILFLFMYRHDRA